MRFHYGSPVDVFFFSIACLEDVIKGIYVNCLNQDLQDFRIGRIRGGVFVDENEALAPEGRHLCRNVYNITIEPRRGDICIAVFRESAEPKRSDNTAGIARWIPTTVN
jgi:hypothetical protein